MTFALAGCLLSATHPSTLVLPSMSIVGVPKQDELPVVEPNGKPFAVKEPTGNDHLEYTNGLVKEQLAYSGRGRPLRV